MYRIESASSRIKRELRRISPLDRARIAEAVQALADDPRPPGVVQLEQDVYRLRLGDYRVIYKSCEPPDFTASDEPHGVLADFRFPCT